MKHFIKYPKTTITASSRRICSNITAASDIDCRYAWNELCKFVKWKWDKISFRSPDMILYQTDDPDGMYRITYQDMCNVLQNDPTLSEINQNKNDNTLGFNLYCQLDGDNISFDEAIKIYQSYGKKVPRWLLKAADEVGLDYWYEQ